MKNHTPISPCQPYWFLAIKTYKNTNAFFWHFRHKLQPKSEHKNQTWPKLHKQNTFKIVFTHFAFWYLQVIFHHKLYSMYSSNHLKNIMYKIWTLWWFELFIHKPFFFYHVRPLIHMQPSISFIASKTISQRLVSDFSRVWKMQGWNWSTNKKVENALFVFPKILNTIDLQTNTTKVVIKTLPNYH